MELIGLTKAQIIPFLLVFFRTGAILFVAPFFGSREIGVRIRVLLSFVIAMILTVSLADRIDVRGILAASSVPGSMQYLPIALAILKEATLGLAIGYAAQLTFTGIQLAGQLVSNELGFSMMTILDPSMNANVTIISQYNMVFATIIFLLIHGHHYILIGIAESFSKIPLGTWIPSALFIGHLNDIFSGVFRSAFTIAIPAMAALFLTKIAMAIIARTMPQMNVFIVGFPVQIAVGLLAMAVSLPFFVKILNTMFILMRDNIMNVMGNT